MRQRVLIFTVMVAAAIAVEACGAAGQARPAGQPGPPGKSAQAAPKAAVAKAWTAPKTPWGDPDLQGTWTSDDCIGTPMSRPVNLGEKLYFTEEELAQKESQLARQAENDKEEFV